RRVLSVPRVPCAVLPQPCSPPRGDLGSPSPACCPPSFGEATEADHVRSAPVGMALWRLARLAISTRHRQTGHGHRVASEGFPAVLDVEGSIRAAWPASRSTACA